MPVTVVFDVNGTLLDPEGIGDPWEVTGFGVAVLDETVFAAVCETVRGVFRPFSELLEAAITAEASRRRLDLGRVGEAVGRAAALDPFPEAGHALELLREGGHRVAALTNSGAEKGRAALEAAGLAERFEAILGTDAVEAYKPHPHCYRHALEELGTEPEETMLVAAHWWDVAGAASCGWRTAWISRTERVLTPAAPEPEIQAADLLDAARQITGR